MHVIVMIALFAVAFAAASLLPRREIESPRLALVRALFPSWRFFDDIQEVPRLEVRVRLESGEWSEYRAVLVAPSRSALSLVWNPEGNLWLAYHSLFERLERDLEKLDNASDPESLVSYRLVLNLVEGSLARDQGALPPLQFRLRAGDTDVLVSTIHHGETATEGAT